MPGPLWEATRDLHHACEAHEVGAAMASGTPPREWYAAWLLALDAIHGKVDPWMPVVTHRRTALAADLAALGCPVETPPAALAYASSLGTARQVQGAAYVLLGAGLMGGAIIKRRMAGWPTAHLDWADRPAALAVLQELRVRDELADDARACFSALLAVMDDIRGLKG